MQSSRLIRTHRSALGLKTLGLAFGLLLNGSALAAPLSDLVVTVRSAGTDGRGALVKVDAVTGVRTLLSDFGDPSQGTPLGATVSGVTVDASGNYVVLDRTGGSNGRSLIVRVDAATGHRTLVSDLGDATQGPISANPEAVHLLPDGDYFVPEEDHARPGIAVLYRVDHVTGQRTILNDLTDPSLGPTAVQAERGAIELLPGGGYNILLTDQNAGSNGQGALFRIDGRTNQRTLLSDLGNPEQGPVQINSEAVVIERDGNVIVIEGDNPEASVLRVDPVTGLRTLVSDFGDPSQGPIGISVGETGAIEADGSLILVGNVRVHPEGEEEGEHSEEEEDEDVIKRVLLRVNTTTGERVIFSDFGDESQGLVGGPSHVAVIASYLGLPAMVVGTDGDDVLQGTDGNDVIVGLGGDDVIIGGAGIDVLVGGKGDDILSGEDGDDVLVGGAGQDVLDGGQGWDILDGGFFPETAIDGEELFNLP